VSAAIGGFRLGFVTRVVSWIGLGIGLYLAVRLLPPVLEGVDAGNDSVALVLAVTVVAAGALIGQAVGFVIGGRLRPKDPDGVVRPVDGGLGALAGVAGLLAVVWLLLPLLGDTSGWVAAQVRGSWVARQIDARLPDPPDAAQALRSVVGEDRFPEVFAVLRPTPALAPPPAGSGLDQATADRVARSVVKVEGLACRKVQNGSGFVVDDDLVVTNAHVVAGESSTSLQLDDGEVVEAEVVAFDPARDLAVLRAPGLDRPALPLAAAAAGARGGVFGHPAGAPLRLAPFEVARQITATGRDIYGTELTERDVLEVAASLQPGDSGAALVAPDGTVVGVAFAIARDRGDVAYALATNEVEAILAGPLVAVDTGACLG
jgi:S1-C subfamily serine protease